MASRPRSNSNTCPGPARARFHPFLACLYFRKPPNLHRLWGQVQTVLLAQPVPPAWLVPKGGGGWQPRPAATWSWGRPVSSSWIVPKSGGRARTPQHLQEATKHLSTSLNQLAQVFKQPLNSLPVLKPHSVQSLYSSRNRNEKSN